jgi:hypothetical protein
MVSHEENTAEKHTNIQVYMQDFFALSKHQGLFSGPLVFEIDQDAAQ